jgi:hypothetical protein
MRKLQLLIVAFLALAVAGAAFAATSTEPAPLTKVDPKADAEGKAYYFENDANLKKFGAKKQP